MARNKRQSEHRKTHVPKETFLVWCGPLEGFLSIIEMVDKTDKGIKQYAKQQPLRYRSAMVPRQENGKRVWLGRKKKPKNNDKTKQAGAEG